MVMKWSRPQQLVIVPRYNRVLVTVLRETLLKQLDNGAFEPRKLKREKVKEVLLSFRRNLQEAARSECKESSVTTFDYV